MTEQEIQQGRERGILQLVSQQIIENPAFVGDIIECVTYSLRQAEKMQRESLVRKDKALEVLFKKTNYGNDKNLEDVANEMTNNVFNGTGRIYTVQDIKKAIKKKK